RRPHCVSYAPLATREIPHLPPTRGRRAGRPRSDDYFAGNPWNRFRTWAALAGLQIAALA
ncbi:MAG TPA: hypothetical protein VLN49_18110, partial [Gemmatimonadaceae bacterium]|nr:hypothetical protein [Gemmatimonadaceae bacterium]